MSVPFQTVVYYGLFLVPLFLVIVAICIEAVLPTAANLAFVVISLSDPAGVLAMVLAHKKYRTAVMRLFHKGLFYYFGECEKVF